MIVSPLLIFLLLVVAVSLWRAARYMDDWDDDGWEDE